MFSRCKNVEYSEPSAMRRFFGNVMSVLFMWFVYFILCVFEQKNGWAEGTVGVLWFVTWTVQSFMFPKCFSAKAHDVFWWLFLGLFLLARSGSSDD